MDELVRRLRELAAMMDASLVDQDASDCAQAADTLARLAADLAVYKQTTENLSAQNDALRELATAADAKSARLAAALEGLVGAVESTGLALYSAEMVAARSALREVGRG